MDTNFRKFTLKREDKELLLNGLKGLGIGLLIGLAITHRRNKTKCAEQNSKKFIFSPRYIHDEFYTADDASTLKRVWRHFAPAAIPFIMEMIEKRIRH